MSPSVTPDEPPQACTQLQNAQAKLKPSFGTFKANLNLSITGIGVSYPPHQLTPSVLDTLCERHYPDTPAMRKIRSINNYTGILSRSAIGNVDHPLANLPTAPSITQLSEFFLDEGVKLSVAAAKKALAEAGLRPGDVTHVVSTTCTNSANPGFDHFVCRALGIGSAPHSPVEKVLLHGVGCSGGLAALRTAANLLLGASFRGRKARALVLATEISSLLVRSELDSIHESQETRIGVALFSDCAGAVVLSNGIEDSSEDSEGEGEEGDEGDEMREEEPIYELLGWEHRVVPDTEKDLGFDVDPLGWKVILTPRVPSLTASVVPSTYANLLSSLPSVPEKLKSSPRQFDWALHPGGSSILTGVEKAMGISAEHMRASYDVYMNHGNSSSATIISVLDRLRSKEMDQYCPADEPVDGGEGNERKGGPGKPKEYVVGCAFGPGITVEMCMFRRNLGFTGRNRVPLEGQSGLGNGTNGLVTPPETESEGSRSEGEEERLVEAMGRVELD